MRFDKIQRSRCVAAVGPHFRLGRGSDNGADAPRHSSTTVLSSPKRCNREPMTRPAETFAW
jgi:hypothetical protein